jgi:hypothetical protein
MVSFGYIKHKQKNLKFAWQPFGTQSLFWVKINLDWMVKWRGLDKINVHTIYNLQFFNDHKTSCLWFIKHDPKKKIEKIMQCPSIISPPLWYGSGFFPKKNIIMHLLFKNAKNTFF